MLFISIFKIRISVKLLKDSKKTFWLQLNELSSKLPHTQCFFITRLNQIPLHLKCRKSPQNAWYLCNKLFQTRKEWKQFRAALSSCNLQNHPRNIFTPIVRFVKTLNFLKFQNLISKLDLLLKIHIILNIQSVLNILFYLYLGHILEGKSNGIPDDWLRLRLDLDSCLTDRSRRRRGIKASPGVSQASHPWLIRRRINTGNTSQQLYDTKLKLLKSNF